MTEQSPEPKCTCKCPLCLSAPQMLTALRGTKSRVEGILLLGIFMGQDREEAITQRWLEQIVAAIAAATGQPKEQG